MNHQQIVTSHTPARHSIHPSASPEGGSQLRIKVNDTSSSSSSPSLLVQKDMNASAPIFIVSSSTTTSTNTPTPINASPMMRSFQGVVNSGVNNEILPFPPSTPSIGPTTSDCRFLPIAPSPFSFGAQSISNHSLGGETSPSPLQRTTGVTPFVSELSVSNSQTLMPLDPKRAVAAVRGLTGGGFSSSSSSSNHIGYGYGHQFTTGSVSVVSTSHPVQIVQTVLPTLSSGLGTKRVRDNDSLSSSISPMRQTAISPALLTPLTSSSFDLDVPVLFSPVSNTLSSSSALPPPPAHQFEAMRGTLTSLTLPASTTSVSASLEEAEEERSLKRGGGGGGGGGAGAVPIAFVPEDISFNNNGNTQATSTYPVKPRPKSHLAALSPATAVRIGKGSKRY